MEKRKHEKNGVGVFGGQGGSVLCTAVYISRVGVGEWKSRVKFPEISWNSPKYPGNFPESWVCVHSRSLLREIYYI